MLPACYHAGYQNVTRQGSRKLPRCDRQGIMVNYTTGRFPLVRTENSTKFPRAILCQVPSTEMAISGGWPTYTTDTRHEPGPWSCRQLIRLGQGQVVEISGPGRGSARQLIRLTRQRSGETSSMARICRRLPELSQGQVVEISGPGRGSARQLLHRPMRHNLAKLLRNGNFHRGVLSAKLRGDLSAKFATRPRYRYFA